MKEKYYIGIDLGGTSIKLGIVDKNGDIVAKYEAPTPHAKYEETIELFVKMIEQTGIEKDQMLGVGIGVPGFVNIEDGSIDELVNVGWKNVHLKNDLEKKVGLPVFVDNDANLAALGEMWKGAGNGLTDLVCITIGTGVGAGVIINEKIYHGKNAMAGEVGHITINPHSEIRCNCGKNGCLETEVSATAMVNFNQRAIEGGKETLLPIEATTKDIFEAAQKGDSLAIEIIDNTANYLGLALSQIATVLAPERIVIGGGVSKAGELLLRPTMQYFKRYSTEKIAEQTEIVLAELENDAGIVGASRLVADQMAK